MRPPYKAKGYKWFVLELHLKGDTVVKLPQWLKEQGVRKWHHEIHAMRCRAPKGSVLQRQKGVQP